MATPDWTTVPDTSLEPGDPIRSIDIIAINNHAAAMSGGAAGAPEIKLMAIETLSGGTTIRSRIDAEVSTTNVTIDVHSFSFCQIGTINAYIEHKSAGPSSVVRIYRTRNGADSLVASWSTTSSSYVARNIDIAVLPGDRVRMSLSGGPSDIIPVYARNARFRTNGENMWPGASFPLENDYTVI